MRPFPALVDPGCFFLSSTHRDSLAALLYAAAHRSPLSTLTGSPGVGKTTVASALSWQSERLHAPLLPLRLADPFLSPMGVVSALSRRFAPESPSLEREAQLDALAAALRRLHARGATPLLLVDDAHRLENGTLEQIRALVEWTAGGDPLLPVILLGPPSLDERLALSGPASMPQMIEVQARLESLRPAEVAAYVDFRWRHAGLGEHPFTADALTALAVASGCVPRNIHRLCCLALGRAKVSRAIQIGPEWFPAQPECPRRKVQRTVVAMGRGQV